MALEGKAVSAQPLETCLPRVLARRIARAANPHFTIGTGGGTQPTGFSAEHHHRVSLGTGNTTSCADGLDCSTIGAGNAR